MSTKQHFYSIAAALLMTVMGAPGANAQGHAQILERLDSVQEKLDALTDGQMVPFTVQGGGGLCGSGPAPSIVIDGTGSHPFIVTSVILKTSPLGGLEGALAAKSLVVEGTVFDIAGAETKSADLMASLFAARTKSTSLPGGNFPYQIVADSPGADDIRIELSCSDPPVVVETVRVSGWKSPADSMSVTYTQ